MRYGNGENGKVGWPRLVVTDRDLSRSAFVDHCEMLKKVSAYKSEVGLAASTKVNAAEFSVDGIVQVWYVYLAEMYIYLF